MARPGLPGALRRGAPAAAPAAALPGRGNALASVADRHRIAGGPASAVPPSATAGPHDAGDGAAAPPGAAAIDSTTTRVPPYWPAPSPGAISALAIADSRVGGRLVSGPGVYYGAGTPDALPPI